MDRTGLSFIFAGHAAPACSPVGDGDMGERMGISGDRGARPPWSAKAAMTGKAAIAAKAAAVTCAFLLAAAPCGAREPLTKADSGWTDLFNGKDLTGLYIRLGGVLQNPAAQSSFKVEAGTMHVPATGGVGAIATKAVYSRYQVRVEYRFGKGQTNPNAGLLYHIDPGDYQEGNAFGTRNAAVPYLSGAYAKSVEYQMYRGDAGAFLGIVNVWVTAETKGDALHTWQPGGTLFTAYPSGGLEERRIYRSVNAAPDDSDWVRFEGKICGADSVAHIVNGTVVMRGRNLRTNEKPDITTRTDPDQFPMDRGHVGLQTEGAEVFYRNWDIRMLDTNGVPIIKGCMDSKSPDYNPLANVQDGTCQSTMIMHGPQSRLQGASAAAAKRLETFTLLGKRIRPGKAAVK